MGEKSFQGTADRYNLALGLFRFVLQNERIPAVYRADGRLGFRTPKHHSVERSVGEGRAVKAIKRGSPCLVDLRYPTCCCAGAS